MKPVSFWLDTAAPFANAIATPVQGRTDVAIVGGGLCGLSAALTLARKGISAVVLEAGPVMAEASGRNGGHCNNGLSHDFVGVRDRFGVERAREMYRAFDAGVDLVEAISRDENINCDFVRSGKLKLAAKPEHFDKIKRNQEILAREVDSDTVLLSRAELASEIGTQRYHGGVVQRRSGNLHVGRFGIGLAEAAARKGARIFENAAVSNVVRKSPGRFQITTTRGMVEAGHVILASGTSRTGPFGWFRRRIIPVGSFIVVTEPLGSELAKSIMPGRRNCTTSQNIGHYFRMTADDRLVFGGRARFAMSSPRSDLKSGRVLERNMREIFPQLADTRIDYCWGGLVDMSSDRLPRSGITPSGMHYAMGFSGHGVQMSTYMGNLMARRVAGEAVANPWRDIDWPAVPGHFGTPWFLPAVGVYYRLMDRLH
ncbi:MAG: FAD-binding oxidoreductase [Hyphomicrobiaceae bacterium]